MQSADAIGCFNREVEAVSFNYLRREWNILDPALAEDFKQLEKVQDAEFSVVSETSDQRTWIVTFSKDNGPSASYIYNRCCVSVHVSVRACVRACLCVCVALPHTYVQLMAGPGVHQQLKCLSLSVGLDVSRSDVRVTHSCISLWNAVLLFHQGMQK